MELYDNFAHIDLDGTVADFDGEMSRFMAELAAPGEPDYHSYGWNEAPRFIKNRRNMIKHMPGFWRNLPRIEKGFEIVDLLRKHKFSLHVLTKGPRKNPQAWAEKADWCSEHLPDASITVTQDKSLVYSRILFDDYPPYFEKWLLARPRGLVISVKHPWNENTDNPRVILFDGTNKNQVEEAIIKVKERSSGKDWL